eukprot:58597-Prymnesium_polylepis.1
MAASSVHAPPSCPLAFRSRFILFNMRDIYRPCWRERCTMYLVVPQAQPTPRAHRASTSGRHNAPKQQSRECAKPKCTHSYSHISSSCNTFALASSRTRRYALRSPGSMAGGSSRFQS